MTETKALSLSPEVLTVQLLSSFEPNRTVVAAALQQYKRERERARRQLCTLHVSVSMILYPYQPDDRSFAHSFCYTNTQCFFTRTTRWQQGQSYKKLQWQGSKRGFWTVRTFCEKFLWKNHSHRSTQPLCYTSTERHTLTHTQTYFSVTYKFLHWKPLRFENTKGYSWFERFSDSARGESLKAKPLAFDKRNIVVSE